ncbi:hypothetical protein LAZ67_3004341 [Cordylochernes scorpioides]|uniref:RNA-directed DNA polymerase n=1 Tax=Cordylochernes scorpioides TaxID=51811 RepID=A0ABY6KC46_9ARAC|nr:hypothetical protein LAZ67_3004341 [Cordylochernes scorpioides]
MTRLIAALYYWDGMTNDIRTHVRTCSVCQLVKPPKGPIYGELGQLPPAVLPYELVSLDTISGFAKYGNSQTFLHVVVDHATRYALAFPSRSTSILTYTQVIKKVMQFGSPKRLLTDRAPAFTSPKFRRFLIRHNIGQLLTTSNNPQANGLSSFPLQLSEHVQNYPKIDDARELAYQRTHERHLRDKARFDQTHRASDFEINYKPQYIFKSDTLAEHYVAMMDTFFEYLDVPNQDRMIEDIIEFEKKIHEVSNVSSDDSTRYHYREDYNRTYYNLSQMNELYPQVCRPVHCFMLSVYLYCLLPPIRRCVIQSIVLGCLCIFIVSFPSFVGVSSSPLSRLSVYLYCLLPPNRRCVVQSIVLGSRCIFIVSFSPIVERLGMDPIVLNSLEVTIENEDYLNDLLDLIADTPAREKALSEIAFMKVGGPPHISRGAKQLLLKIV